MSKIALYIRLSIEDSKVESMSVENQKLALHKFVDTQTLGAASDFISRTIEDNAHKAMDFKTYADYIATRPRAEKFGSHGLFTDDGVQVDLQKVSQDLNEHKGRFDHISHQWILEHIPIDKKMLRKWLKCGYIETKKLFPTEEGALQGSPISPVICNMVLDGLQPLLKKNFHQIMRKGKQYSPMVNFVRFADDFIITGENHQLLQEEVLPMVREFMAERGLQLSEEKTVITHIDDGFDFLGCNIRKYKGKLLIKSDLYKFSSLRILFLPSLVQSSI